LEFIKGRKLADDNNVICMANCWLEDRDQHIVLHRNPCFGEMMYQVYACQLQDTMLKGNKI